MTDLDLIEIPIYIRRKIIMESPCIKTPYHDSVKIVFADFTASGRPSPIIENNIQTKVLPYYSNTHSNAYCGIMMKNLVKETKVYLRESLNLATTKKIIFTGSGTTAAINHLIYCLNLKLIGKKVNVFITPYEHNSNYLPWYELKKNPNIDVHILKMKENFDIDINNLKRKLEYHINDINIISITACSNVLGIKINLKEIYNIIQTYNTQKCLYDKRNLLFVDYACCAPYVKIDGRFSDALFISPHKFLGGISTPGLLIAEKSLFHNQSPFIPGGGCVKKVCSKYVQYEKDIEKRETAGTPNIVGIIKIKYVFKLKDIFLNTITHNEHSITKYVFQRMRKLESKHKDLTIVLPNCCIDKRLPIVCVAIKNVHYNLIVVLLNDLFGIQTRGGVSCTGTLVEIIEKKYNIHGWCRITFNWLMSQKEIDYIISSLKYIIMNVHKYKSYYTYIKHDNLFIHESMIK